jgi:folate-binding protein YgfZ
MTTRIGSAALKAARDSAVTAQLGPAPAVRLAGPDARRFCNGMFTANIRDLRVGGAARSALVDDRGRLFGLLDVLCTANDTFLALLDGIDVAEFMERFEKFVVFDDVTLTDETALWVRATEQGPAVQRPPPGTFVDDHGTIVLGSRRSPAGGIDRLAAPGVSVDAIGVAVGPEEIEALRVLAGRVAYPADTGDKGLPHELGLRDETLSFEKGCYVGQESINRIDVMGTIKRALAGVHVREPRDLAADEVAVGDAVAGRLTSPVLLPDGSLFGLAVLRKPADTPGTVVRIDGAEGTVTALPFAFGP